MARTWAELLGDAEGPYETETARQGFVTRLRDSLSRSRRALTEQLAVAAFDPADQGSWERLEEALLTADVGVSATAELVRRLEALLRRAGGDGAVEAVGLRLDPVTHSVRGESAEVALTPTEFRLLARLLANPGEAVRRRDLVRAGWPHGAIVHENTLDAYIARLRRKLRALEAAPQLVTVHGVGYRFS